VKKLVSHTSSQESMSSAEGGSNVSRSILWCQSGTLVIICWAHEQSGHCDEDGGYAWAQEHGLLLTKASLVTALLNAQSASNRDLHMISD
jgi:hypothetical protein